MQDCKSVTVTCARRQLALTSSQATPMDTCPGLRPRWRPEHTPYRIHICCLPDFQKPSALLLTNQKLS